MDRLSALKTPKRTHKPQAKEYCTDRAGTGPEKVCSTLKKVSVNGPIFRIASIFLLITQQFRFFLLRRCFVK